MSTRTETRKTGSDYMRVVELMKEIGSKDGFEPIPWSQIAWHMAPGQPLINRLWGWLASKTLRKGHWSPFALEVGRDGRTIELHLENAAADLKADEANVRRAWREGLERGCWRNGTHGEGPRRLYICGNVPPAQEVCTDLSDQPSEVCTDLLPSPILKQIKDRAKDWPAERVAQLRSWYEQRLCVRSTVLADVVAAARNILDQDDDTGLREWGLEPSRNKEHATKVPPEAREARKERLAPLVPEIQRYVQTAIEFVQSSDFALYNGKSGHVQTRATLLPETTPRREIDQRASAPSDTPYSPPEPPLSSEVKKLNQLPAPKAPDLSESEKTAEKTLFAAFAKMQQAYKNTDFGAEQISPDNKADLLLVHRVLAAVGSANVIDFLQSVARKFRGVGKGAMGKLPPRAPGEPTGPRSLGLILMWARDYGRHLDESARASAEERERVRANEISSCLELLRDPNETAEAKEHYRELLRSYGVPIEGASHA